MLKIHENIEKKLQYFLERRSVPHLLFYGESGSGKKTLLHNFLQKIYHYSRPRMKENVMHVNCAQVKGIKFIREELKFFAKTNIPSTIDIPFKSIVLLNADFLTIDAQSALRRCIELFSYSTRFFIVVENKNKLLNPILSRFCEIYVPLPPCGNLHRYHIDRVLPKGKNHMEWVKEKLTEKPVNINTWVTEFYEEGISCLDVTNVLSEDNVDLLMYFYKIKAEYRCEKMLLFSVIHSYIYGKDDLAVVGTV